MPTTPVTRSLIYNNLQAMQLTHPYKRVYPYWASPTIGRLKELAIRQSQKYAAYNRLLDSFLTLADSQGGRMEFTLHLPSMKALRAINIEGLLKLINENEEISREVVRRCFHPLRGEIDLRPLIHLHQKYLPSIKVKE